MILLEPKILETVELLGMGASVALIQKLQYTQMTLMGSRQNYHQEPVSP